MTFHADKPGALAAESAAAAELARAWQCTATRFPYFCELDYFLEQRRELIALMEVKCRNVPSRRYPDVWLDAYKFLFAVNAARAFHCPVFFLVQFTDQLAYCNLLQTEIGRPTIDGRLDRNDPADRDLVVHIPLSAFREV